MDLHHLFRREQISFVNAERANGRSARAAHAALARGDAGMIAEKPSLDRYRNAPVLPAAC